MLGIEKQVQDVTEMLRDTLSQKSLTHKQAILAEFKRREDKANAEQMAKDNAANAKARR